MTARGSKRIPLGYPLVILATAGWGTSGLFITLVRRAQPDLTALALAFWRDLSTFLCLLIAVAIFKPALLRVSRKDLIWLAALGAIGFGAFHVFWNLSVATNHVAVATVLQEACPAIVAILAWLFWRESLTWIKAVAILITFLGCVLVAGIQAVGATSVTGIGVAIGMVSAFTYATSSLFGKQVAGHLSPVTVLLYGFGFASLVLLPLQFIVGQPLPAWPMLTPAAGWFVALILLPTIASWGAYALGLRYLAASVAAILATSEVVFASVYAYVFLGERLDLLQVLGALLVISGVVALYLPSLRRPAEVPAPAL